MSEGAKSRAEAEETRRAQALRENLRKRKVQQNKRDIEEDADDSIKETS